MKKSKKTKIITRNNLRASTKKRKEFTQSLFFFHEDIRELAIIAPFNNNLANGHSFKAEQLIVPAMPGVWSASARFRLNSSRALECYQFEAISTSSFTRQAGLETFFVDIESTDSFAILTESVSRQHSSNITKNLVKYLSTWCPEEFVGLLNVWSHSGEAKVQLRPGIRYSSDQDVLQFEASADPKDKHDRGGVIVCTPFRKGRYKLEIDSSYNHATRISLTFLSNDNSNAHIKLLN